MNGFRCVFCLLLVLLPILLGGCAQHWQAITKRDALHQRVQQGGDFRHRLLWNETAQQALTTPAPRPRIWHVFIEGDGHAVNVFGQPSADPTPLAAILLPALAVDTLPALYLGRPCYFATDDPQCNPWRWTLERYSAATVVSLKKAATTLIPAEDKVILIGHSGGGALAMLLAARWPQTCAVITLAGNLDVGAWLKTNAFTPLPDSLDPATQPHLPPGIAQWHFAGANDKVILPRWIAGVSAHQDGAHFVELANTDHITPWQHHLLSSLKYQQNQQSPENVLAPLLPALDNTRAVCGKVTE